MILFLLMYFCETLRYLLVPLIVQYEVDRNETPTSGWLVYQKQPTSIFRVIEMLLDENKNEDTSDQYEQQNKYWISCRGGICPILECLNLVTFPCTISWTLFCFSEKSFLNTFGSIFGYILKGKAQSLKSNIYLFQLDIWLLRIFSEECCLEAN